MSRPDGIGCLGGCLPRGGVAMGLLMALYGFAMLLMHGCAGPPHGCVEKLQHKPAWTEMQTSIVPGENGPTVHITPIFHSEEWNVWYRSDEGSVYCRSVSKAFWDQLVVGRYVNFDTGQTGAPLRAEQ